MPGGAGLSPPVKYFTDRFFFFFFFFGGGGTSFVDILCFFLSCVC